MENLPAEVIEEVKFMVKLIKPVVKPLAKPIVDTIRRLQDRYKESDDNDLKDCIEDAVLMLTQETQAQKSFHLDKFVENTLLDPECELEPATIFSFLKDIEQMTWRQFCLLEGFFRNENINFTINGKSDSDINGISIKNEIEKLINLNYLRSESDDPDWVPIKFDTISITQLGREISNLLVLHSVEDDEIGSAFGNGKITVTKQRRV